MNSSCVPEPPSFSAKAADPKNWVILWIILLLYVFWGIKIVVNKAYLPASKVLAYKLNFSQDFAWATLLAASNSAPIFFVNWFSTFQDSPTTTGIGTVLGSIAFKSLFVISICGFIRRSHTDLSWMPVFRDFLFLIIGISVLFHFFRKKADSFYVDAETRLRFCINGIESHCCYQSIEADNENIAPIEHGVITQSEARVMLFLYPFYLFFFQLQDRIRWWVESLLEKAAKGYSSQYLDQQNNPKTSHEQLLRNSHIAMLLSADPIEHLGIILVTHSRWKVRQTFCRLDIDGDGKIDRYEMMTMLRSFGQPVDEATALDLIKSIDEYCVDGQVEYKPFKEWFINMEAKLVNEMRHIFKSLDKNNSGTVRARDAETVLQYLGNQPSLKTIRATREMLDINKVGFVSQKDLFYWYRACMLHHRFAKQSIGLSTQNPQDLQEVSMVVRNDLRINEHSKDGISEHHVPRNDSYYDSDHDTSPSGARVAQTLIISPDVNREQFEGPVVWPPPKTVIQKIGWALSLPFTTVLYFFTVLPTGTLKDLTLCKSIWWLIVSVIIVALLCAVALASAEVIGKTFGIPDTVIGVVLLGIGLSWGWLWSMIEAVKAGHAEIVLSRSFGCVVFDVLVSVPCSWLISLKRMDGLPILQNGTNITSSLACLWLILLVTFVLFMISSFRLNTTISVTLLVYYITFILQDMGLASWDNLNINSLHTEDSEVVIFCAGCETDEFCLSLR
mmetsp:Transcript_16569/g.18751  ORF Transcript_16569/g.18751 Transcript_16569/m.18751 type:complete len:730 (+) Transcript_16569:151-2340(+)|eukprot:CAMPEP_0184072990 /NCGR_PEP_ID=MMETSP0957-20130417/62044_1 /TAXON_ID=627963 /ORGANISM="Aplanochytrium sp, Strain PBS07" /LENGTH=729 /DNA_ID=CAMNT_0026374327 /DNA_START=70 /DNA_END=2259 /DNA_ORIENTATION=+